MNPRVPRAVVFDLGKVLLDFDYGVLARRIAPMTKLSPAEFRAVVDQTPLLHRYETGLMSDTEFFEVVAERTGYRGGFAEFAALFGDIFTEIPPMVALRHEVAATGLPTWVFSNTNAMAIAHVRRAFPFYAGFTGEILSYEVRSMKPDAAIYAALEARTGLSGPDLLYLDDRAENIAAAAARGWRALLHVDPAATVPAVRALLG